RQVWYEPVAGRRAFSGSGVVAGRANAVCENRFAGRTDRSRGDNRELQSHGRGCEEEMATGRQNPPDARRGSRAARSLPGETRRQRACSHLRIEPQKGTEGTQKKAPVLRLFVAR